MLRETVTVSFGEGKSKAIGRTVTSMASKIQTTAVVIFVLTTCYTHSSNKILFDHHQSIHACLQHQRNLHNTVQWMKILVTKYVGY